MTFEAFEFKFEPFKGDFNNSIANFNNMNVNQSNKIRSIRRHNSNYSKGILTVRMQIIPKGF